MRILNYLFPIAVILFLFSCCTSRHKPLTIEDVAVHQDTLVNINKALVGLDDERIKAYSERHKLQLEVNQSGLWYKILEKGNGRAVEKGKIITIGYKVSLLDGTLCYSSDSTGNRSFVVGQGGVENGLEIGILMLNEGGSAIFVMPPFLAHGLIGDEDRIPSRSIIRYDVEVVKISDR
jgi:FKBP-type peptidyl-prolyl cis-trans isomerase